LELTMIDKEMLDRMTNRFLTWRLPETFGPDCFVSFDRAGAKRNQSWPVGTNILTFDEARAMLEHILEPLVERIRATNKPPAQVLLEDGGAWRLQQDAIVKQERPDNLGPQRFLQAGTLVIPPPVSHRSWCGVPVWGPTINELGGDSHDLPRPSVDISLTINGPGGGSGGSGRRLGGPDSLMRPKPEHRFGSGSRYGGTPGTATFASDSPQGVDPDVARNINAAHLADTAAKQWHYPMRDTHESDKDYAQRCKLEFTEWLHAHGLPQIVAWAHDGNGRVDVCHALIKQLLVNAGLKKQVEHYTIPLVPADLQQLTQDAYRKANLPPDVEDLQRQFTQVWAEMKRRGFQYGPGALEHVQMGFMMAHGVMPRGSHD
jgi:hypothetical protein